MFVKSSGLPVLSGQCCTRTASNQLDPALIWGWQYHVDLPFHSSVQMIKYLFYNWTKKGRR